VIVSILKAVLKYSVIIPDNLVTLKEESWNMSRVF